MGDLPSSNLEFLEWIFHLEYSLTSRRISVGPEDRSRHEFLLPSASPISTQSVPRRLTIDRPDPSALSHGASSHLFTVLLLAGAVALGIGPASAQNLDRPLQRSQVREYIRLRLETYQFQEQMKSNAGQYDNLPRPFLERRNKHLRAEGKTTSRWSCHRRLPRRPVRCAGPLVPRSPTPSGGATKC